MASVKRADFVRQHREIELVQAPMTLSSIEFFRDLLKTAAEGNKVVNYLSSSFEESGLYELSGLIAGTGGFIISVETWEDSLVGQSLLKYFEGGLLKASGGECEITINSSKEFRICGCIGPCVGLDRPDIDLTSQKVVGEGGTVAWKVCGLLPTTTLAFFFDVAASKIQPIPAGTTSFLQFVTKYRHLGTGAIRLRVTTVHLRFADLTSGKLEIARGFDQEAAGVLIARHAMWAVQNEEVADVVHDIDRMLIRFCRAFGTYQKANAVSFELPENMNFLPGFLYHFRRSPFLSTFNSSPDETTSLRHSLLTEDVTNSLFMIQPALVKYLLNGDPRPVQLDTASLQSDSVLLLDTFFRVLVWHGSKIVAWRNQGYHEQEEYTHLKRLLEDPRTEAETLVGERFPSPSLVMCDQGGSLERYLLARCNPSESQFDVVYGTRTESLSTDEPSLDKFLQKLKEMAVIPG
jgi:protein transport protein SEC23